MKNYATNTKKVTTKLNGRNKIKWTKLQNIHSFLFILFLWTINWSNRKYVQHHLTILDSIRMKWQKLLKTLYNDISVLLFPWIIKTKCKKKISHFSVYCIYVLCSTARNEKLKKKVEKCFFVLYLVNTIYTSFWFVRKSLKQKIK